RFEVAVQHAALVGIVDGLRDLLHVARGPSGRQRPRAHKVGKIVPLNEIHCEIGLAFPFTYFVDTDDVWMLETRRCLRFGTEPFDGSPAGELAGQDHLERHLAVEVVLASSSRTTSRYRCRNRCTATPTAPTLMSSCVAIVAYSPASASCDRNGLNSPNCRDLPAALVSARKCARA